MLNSIIYKITCKDNNILDCYVGRTTNFKLRYNMHKYACCNSNNKGHNMKVYIHMRENGGWCNWNMTIVETFEHTNKNEANTKEAYYIKTLNANLNSYIPGRTDKEYYLDHQEKIKHYYQDNLDNKKEYYNTNKEMILKRAEEYYNTNKEMILKKTEEYRKTNKQRIKEKSKEYYQTIKEKKKEYYTNNKIKQNNLN